jgi:tRNA G46 methylase TrmB
MENILPFAEMPPEEGLWDTGGILSPFQPTLNENLIQVFTKIALGTEDILIDLGCGDGRVLLSAAFMQCKLAIGYELNSELIQIARKNIDELGLEESVKIFNCDFLNAELLDVTVIYIYLLPEAIKKLEGMLVKAFSLKTRVIVSLHFPIPWWQGENFQGYFIYYNRNLS